MEYKHGNKTQHPTTSTGINGSIHTHTHTIDLNYITTTNHYYYNSLKINRKKNLKLETISITIYAPHTNRIKVSTVS